MSGPVTIPMGATLAEFAPDASTLFAFLANTFPVGLGWDDDFFRGMCQIQGVNFGFTLTDEFGGTGVYTAAGVPQLCQLLENNTVTPATLSVTPLSSSGASPLFGIPATSGGLFGADIGLQIGQGAASNVAYVLPCSGRVHNGTTNTSGTGWLLMFVYQNFNQAPVGGVAALFGVPMPFNVNVTVDWNQYGFFGAGGEGFISSSFQASSITFPPWP